MMLAEDVCVPTAVYGVANVLVEADYALGLQLTIINELVQLCSQHGLLEMNAIRNHQSAPRQDTM
jgi:hypothetical protein